ncbi:MAG: hypothetical protein ACQESK_08325 [Bacteroidota bacterium]
MKQLILLIFLSPLVLFSQDKLDLDKKYKITDDFELQIISLKRKKTSGITRGSHRTSTYIVAKEGFLHIELKLQIENIADGKKFKDFDKFEIIDKNSNVYTAHICADLESNMKMCRRFKLKLKHNRKQVAIIDFDKPIPDDVEIKHLRFDGVDLVSF